MKRISQSLMAAGLLFTLFLSPGCALFLIGGGVAGGMAISKDTIEGSLDKNLDTVWKAAREVVMKEGFIRLEDKAHGTIEAEVRKSQVNIQVIQLTPQTVQIRVKARKGYKLIPDIKLANELYNKISQKIK